ncbi:hypothetical protein P171DRAFT_179865 [Karstenula rhodostoma CBS 690.94]|uniref:Uncharacterized protein n=1 Tax=Karstenula rhodostoma CBS 690.94 TaxID=1392251 RepID=A0A9P4P5L5_9PLEO|nr:hypothetical protein P171DRAFT_179865 [Karstenula rhodostoma CBS 690.94]
MLQRPRKASLEEPLQPRSAPIQPKCGRPGSGTQRSRLQRSSARFRDAKVGPEKRCPLPVVADTSRVTRPMVGEHGVLLTIHMYYRACCNRFGGADADSSAGLSGGPGSPSCTPNQNPLRHDASTTPSAHLLSFYPSFDTSFFDPSPSPSPSSSRARHPDTVASLGTTKTSMRATVAGGRPHKTDDAPWMASAGRQLAATFSTLRPGGLQLQLRQTEAMAD